ncbi:MAG: DUF695 domain-containing protein [Candidatus Eremiobacteraeota bacterium]|nr:DUF695 domain-containing protein [Candidatus Eremiobacteraeota bacterium]
MSADWHVRVANADGQTVSIAVNIGLYDDAPVAHRAHVYLLTIALLRPGADGLPDAEEIRALDAIEAQVSSDAAAAVDLIKAGSVTGRRVRQMIFYGRPSVNFAPVVTQTTRKHPPYQFSLISKDDPQWETYWALYPEA